MNRREFMQFSALSTLTSAGLFPTLSLADALDNPRKILVLVELEGGNDGLNTLVPYTDPIYQDAKVRRNLSLSKSQIIDVGSNMGMHSSLKPLKSLWDNDQLAWIQNVGFSKPDGSHFRSRDIWETAGTFNHIPNEGWLAQILPKRNHGVDGIVIGQGLGPMSGKRCRSVAMRDPKTFVQQAESLDDFNLECDNPSLQHIVDVQQQLHGAKDVLKRSARMRHIDRYFPVRRTFNNDLRSVAKMIVGGADASVYKVSLGGFDTHASQAIPHKNLLHYLASGLDSFSKAMIGSQMWDNVVVMTYSEFGRRIKQNLSGGTDHGAAAPMLVMGGQVKGGVLYGQNPDLSNHENWNIRHEFDIRSVYGSIAENWWGHANPWSDQGSIDFV